ncbi:MAG: NAD(+) synthase [Lentisphaeria bacterium]|nr:NAD(+) synthase [Lentisphaeria bacterium]
MSAFFRTAAAVPRLEVAAPDFNIGRIIGLYRKAASENASAVLFPELALTGSTCGDLFRHERLLASARKALLRAAEATADSPAILIAGLPWREGRHLFNAVAVCQNGRVSGLAVTGRTPGEDRLPSPDDLPETVTLDGTPVPFGRDLLFETPDFTFAVECGEAFFSASSRSAALAAAGAQLLFIPDASCETAGASLRRKAALESESARLAAGLVFSGAGVEESTGNGVCAGHALIAFDGQTAAENKRFDREESLIFADISPAALDYRRMVSGTFDGMTAPAMRRVRLEKTEKAPDLRFAPVEKSPFIPEDPEMRRDCCREIFSIQTAALAKRFTSSGAKRLVVGLSGGLDSTLALLASVKCCDLLALPRKIICAVTMPGFGTSQRTKGNAETIAERSGAELRVIPIHAAVEQHFRDIGHDPENHDVVYENSQARERTQILMDIANAEKALFVGTGDLSEIALGWCTFNGDHMSMYGVNCGIPKTLMRSMVEFAASESEPELAAALRDICATPVSPELLPGGAQETENIVGSYELHDFFLYRFLRYGEEPETLARLAEKTFAGGYTRQEIDRTLEIFVRRFFTQQFKRNAAPEGPRACAVSLDARHGWRMPSDSSPALWKR